MFLTRILAAARHGSALALHLANALFQTACRFEELIQLNWTDCQAVVGSVFQDVPVPGRLSGPARMDQEGFKGLRILAPGGINFAASQFVFAGRARRFP